MAASAAMMGAGMTFSSFIAAGELQVIGLIACATAAGVFFLLWMLRGPAFDLVATDAYWNRAFAVLFALAALIGSMATVHGWRRWSQDARTFALGGSAFKNVEILQREWDGFRDRFVESPVSYRVPRVTYDRTPVVIWLLGLTSVGCFAEMRYRLKVAARAAGMG